VFNNKIWNIRVYNIIIIIMIISFSSKKSALISMELVIAPVAIEWVTLGHWNALIPFS
jgi:hypothetical protein